MFILQELKTRNQEGATVPGSHMTGVRGAEDTWRRSCFLMWYVSVGLIKPRSKAASPVGQVNLLSYHGQHLPSHPQGAVSRSSWVYTSPRLPGGRLSLKSLLTEDSGCTSPLSPLP